MLLVERENEALKVLEELSRPGLRLVVVGGYAVSAHARHRFSVDCDLVVRKRDLARVASVLKKLEFSKSLERSGFDREYGGAFVRYVKKVGGLPVSVDLMVDSLVSRDTDGAWSYDYILSHSTVANVPSIQSSVKCRIPNRELLLAFKLHSARKADVRDIVMLDQNVDWEEVVRHLDRGDPEKLGSSLNRVLRALEDPRLVDSLKGAFSVKGSVQVQIERTREHLEGVIPKLDKAERGTGKHGSSNL